MNLVRRVVTPALVRGALVGSFLVSAVATNVAMLWTLARGPLSPSELASRPAPAASPIPRRAPLQSMREMPRSLGAAADPRRTQFENHISITQGEKTIALPVHSGTVDIILGPVVLTVAPGATVTWDPTSGSGATPEVHAVLAFSDAPAEDATHGVVLWGTGNDAPAPADKRTLDPFVYVPETLSLPFNFQNNTSRQARVEVVVWTNTGDTPPIDL